MKYGQVIRLNSFVMRVKPLDIVALVGINMLYACVGICTKKAALQSPMSWWYWLWFAGAVAVIGIYAMLWQQVLKRIELGTAYMFKGTSLIFTMLIAALLFGEAITVPNIIGSVIIIVGIVFLARS